MNPNPPNCGNEERLTVGEAAKLIGMSRRRFFDYVNKSVREGGCRYCIPRYGNRKIIFGKWLKEFYYSKMGKI